MSRIALHLATEVGYVHAQVLSRITKLSGPDGVEQLLVCVHASRVGGERAQDRPFDWSEPHRFAVAVRVTRREVDRHAIRFDRTGSTGARGSRTSDLRGHTRSEFGSAERLRYVIVCTGVQERDLVGLDVSCGKDDDGCERVGSNRSTEIQSRLIRETEIENYQIRCLRLDRSECATSVRGVEYSRDS